jgi:trigger factor
MEYTLNTTGPLAREMRIQVPGTQVSDEVSKRLKDLGGRVRIDGFRPGKVPFKLVEQRFSKQVRQEVLGEVIQRSWNEAVSKQGLNPAAFPDISQVDGIERGDVSFTASFEVMPEVGSVDVSGLTIKRLEAEVADKDVDDMIETLRLQRRTWVDRSEPARDGDLIFVAYSASGDGERFPVEGDERVGMILGTGSYLSDFEKAFEGLSTGAEKTVEVAFPADFRQAALAGKTRTVQARLVRVQAANVPALDEGFIKLFGIADGNLESLKRDVRANLERELKQNISARLRAEVVDKVLEANASLAVPESLVRQEMGALQTQAHEQLKRMYGPNAQAPNAAEFADRARKRVRAGLLLSAIAREQQISADPERVSAQLQQIASTYEDPAAVISYYTSQPQLLDGIRSTVLEEQVAEWIAEHAKTEVEPSSFAAIMRPGA